MAGVDFRIYTAAVPMFVAPYSSPDFIYPPASLLIVAPFAMLPDALGFFLWNVMQLTALITGLWLIAPHYRAVMVGLILTSPAIGLLIYFGQFDALLVFALGLGYSGVIRCNPLLVGLALALFTLKPVHVVLPSIVLLLLLPTWRSRAIAAAIPLAVLVASFVVWPTWVQDWLRVAPDAKKTHFLATVFGVVPWRVSTLMRVLIACAGGAYLIAARRRLDAIFATAQLANLLMAPYLNPYSFVLMAPIISTAVQQITGKPPDSSKEHLAAASR